MSKIDWLVEKIEQNDMTQVTMFFENMLHCQTDYKFAPNTESIEKYLYSEEGYSLNDMFHNK